MLLFHACAHASESTCVLRHRSCRWFRDSAMIKTQIQAWIQDKDGLESSSAPIGISCTHHIQTRFGESCDRWQFYAKHGICLVLENTTTQRYALGTDGFSKYCRKYLHPDTIKFNLNENLLRNEPQTLHISFHGSSLQMCSVFFSSFGVFKK